MTIEKIKHLREIFGTGMMQAKRAVEVANERFDGDLLLGFLWTEANSFAINVKGDRSAWNDEWARSSRDGWQARLLEGGRA